METPAVGVTGGLRILLRLEGLALLAAMAAVYAWQGTSWWLFAALFFTPDLSFAGYLLGSRPGAIIYNAVHTTVVPGVLLGIGLVLGQPLAVALAVIWLAHIGFDRALGYGLKQPDGFGFTHLGRIGRVAI
ncbi:MAG: DUF4260 domain-containing protein [Bradyrhizobium sp.]|jgi:hypothetical protein|uniref:DUF4260 domain-containing protein n=1 Tax=Bradyrhizobium sp. TaxID=376 RepID=UPI003C7C3A14